MLWTECEKNPTFQNTPAHHKLPVVPAADSNCCWTNYGIGHGQKGLVQSALNSPKDPCPFETVCLADFGEVSERW